MGPVPNCVDCLDQARCLENVLPIPPPPQVWVRVMVGLRVIFGFMGGRGWVGVIGRVLTLHYTSYCFLAVP